MTVLDYSVALDYILEAASATSLDVTELASLLHLLKVVGLSAPEGMYTVLARYSDIVYRMISAAISLFCLGTSKITQQTVSKTLMVCADRPNHLASPQIRSEVLGLLASYCGDRVRALSHRNPSI